MIIDSLSNAGKYYGLHIHFPQAFEYINSQDPSKLEAGKYTIDGEALHAAVSLKEGVKAADAKFEAHNNHIDIQVCLSGVEELGWKPRNECTEPKGDYNPEKDVIFYNDLPDMYFRLKPGQFAIFFPDDVHAPMIGEGSIKKMVVKVKI